MNLAGTSVVRILAATGLAGAAVLSASAQEPLPTRGHAIQFSDPKSASVSSNVSELGAGKPTLKSLEQQLKKPFELLNPAGELSSDRLVPPVRRPPPSPAMTKRMKAEQERRNQWMYFTAEDFGAAATAEEIFDVPEYGPDGELKKRLTPLERYYERLEKARMGVTNQPRGDSALGGYQQGPNLDETAELSPVAPERTLGPGFNPKDPSFNWMATENAQRAPASESSASKSFNEFFGFGKAELPEVASDRTRSMETRMETFKQLLDSRSSLAPGPGGSALNPLAAPPASQPFSSSLNPFSGGGLGGSPGLSSPGFSSPSPMSGFPQGMGSPGLPSWQSPLTPPEPARSTLAPKFSIPQRKF